MAIDKKIGGIPIKASFADCIRRIEVLNKENVPIHMRTKDIVLEDGCSKKDLISLVEKSINFTIEYDYIVCTVPRPISEIDKWKEEQAVLKQNAIKKS